MDVKSKITPISRYFVKTLLPLFLGGFLFAGALSKYNNVSGLNSTIVEVVLKPMRQTYSKCQETHKELIYKKGQLAGSYYLLPQILKKKMGKQITPNPIIDIISVDSSIFADLSQIHNDVNRLEKQVNQYYTDLYSIVEDGALLLNVYPKYKEFKAARESTNSDYECAKQNALLENMSDFVDDESKYTEFLISMFKFSKTKNLKHIEQLIPILESSQKAFFEIHTIEKQKFLEEEKQYSEIRALYIEEYQKRLNASPFSYLF